MHQYQTNYIENTKKVMELMQHRGLSGLPTEDVGKKLRDSGALIRGLREENSQILREKLFPLLDNILAAEDEDVRFLEEFADMLQRERMDAGVRYYVCNALVTWARVRDRRNLLIKELYMTGMALYEFQNKTEQKRQGNQLWKLEMLFGEAAGYLRFYDEIEDVETRGYIHRSMGNMALGIYVDGQKAAERKFDVIRRSLRVLTDPVYHQKTPELPWDLYIYKSHQERTSLLSYLRSGTATSRDVREVMESAQFVYNRQIEDAEKRGGKPGTRWLYAYYASSYHCGIHSLQELLHNLEKTYATVSHSDYSAEGMYGNIFLPLIYSNYLERDSALVEKKKPVVLMMYRRQEDYLKRVPKDENMNTLFYYIRSCLDVYLEYPGENNFREYIGQVIEGRHLEIHMHSLMVAGISQILLRDMLQKNPEPLLGVRGTKSLQELTEREEALIRFLYDGSMLHDIGKLKQLELYEVPNRGRMAEEEEMHCLHSAYGGRILGRCLSTQDFAPVAMGHHRWYDSQGGYPQEYRREEVQDAALVDIVSVADFIDERCNPAGDYQTDIVSCDEALEELTALGGTRFSPHVVEAALRQRDRIRSVAQSGAGYIWL